MSTSPVVIDKVLTVLQEHPGLNVCSDRSPIAANCRTVREPVIHKHSFAVARYLATACLRMRGTSPQPRKCTAVPPDYEKRLHLSW